MAYLPEHKSLICVLDTIYLFIYLRHWLSINAQNIHTYKEWNQPYMRLFLCQQITLWMIVGSIISRSIKQYEFYPFYVLIRFIDSFDECL